MPSAASDATRTEWPAAFRCTRSSSSMETSSSISNSLAKRPPRRKSFFPPNNNISIRLRADGRAYWNASCDSQLRRCRDGEAGASSPRGRVLHDLLLDGAKNKPPGCIQHLDAPAAAEPEKRRRTLALRDCFEP